MLLAVISANSVGLLHGQTARLSDRRNAYALLLGQTQDGLYDEAEVDKVVAELKAIERAMPDLADDASHWGGRFQQIPQIAVEVKGLIPESDTEAQQQEKFARILSNPASTGISELDRLDIKYGVTRLSPMLPMGPRQTVAECRSANVPACQPWHSLIVTFDTPVDIVRLAQIYGSALGVGSSPHDPWLLGAVVGGSTDITRTELPGKASEYLFTLGAGDCIAGCIYKEQIRISVSTTRDGLRVRKESEKRVK